MQFAYKDTNNSISKHQLISHLQTPRTNTELDYEVATAQQQDNSDATQKKICDYSPNSQTFFKPENVVSAPSHIGQRQPSKNQMRVRGSQQNESSHFVLPKNQLINDQYGLRPQTHTKQHRNFADYSTLDQTVECDSLDGTAEQHSRKFPQYAVRMAPSEASQRPMDTSKFRTTQNQSVYASQRSMMRGSHATKSSVLLPNSN
jgi:hypothetical protein